jgi:predicted Zn-dependent protease
MKTSPSVLNIVRVGNNITFSSLKEIGNKILEVFRGIIKEFQLLHHDSPIVNDIDALLLTTILDKEIGGHILGITDVNLTTSDDHEFYNSIIGGKNPQNDVAVVSTKNLAPSEMTSNRDYKLFISRTLKVSLHEIGHNFGLTDHGSYRAARDGSLCPMSKGEFNKFGYLGYVRAIIDGRGLSFCEECAQFLEKIYALKGHFKNFLADGLLRDMPHRDQPI